jgi:hypothetical protein
MTGAVVDLFHPRRELWIDHFIFARSLIVGKTPSGRATIRVLAMNDSVLVTMRSLLRYDHD